MADSPIIREPEWLTQVADARLEQCIAEGVKEYAKEYEQETVFTTLTDPEEDTDEAVERADRTCDKCGTYVEPDYQFFTGLAVRQVPDEEIKLVMAFGLCATCAHEVRQEI